jgi:SAM-dependent methyltransferase
MAVDSGVELKRLNLGCGRTILPGWINLDRQAGAGVDAVADLDECDKIRLPFDDDTFDEILGSHVFEHLQHPLPFMQELHRVAKTGCKAVFRTPYGSSDDAFEDPTHRRLCFLNTFAFFSQPWFWRADYGYRGDWKVDHIRLMVSRARYQGKTVDEIMADVMRLRNVVDEMAVDLLAVKPIREPKQELHTPASLEIMLIDSLKR